MGIFYGFLLDKAPPPYNIKNLTQASGRKDVKFRLEDIPPEGREEDFKEEPGWMDERLSGEKNRNFEFSGPILIHVHLRRSGRLVTVRSRAEAAMRWICDRCLELFPYMVRSETTTIFKPRPNLPDPEERELSPEDMETDYYDGDELDLTELIRDQVLLAFPAKALCKTDCRGLCPRCGKNRNRERCDCQERGIDPRFAVLKDFRSF